MLSVVKGIEPRNEIEAMLATQIAAVHMASTTYASRLAHAAPCHSRKAPSGPSTS
jgi:hypothetical protein